jgi:hypothetical protein
MMACQFVPTLEHLCDTPTKHTMKDASHLEKTGTNVESQVVVWRRGDSSQATVHAQKLPHARNAWRHTAVLAGKPVILDRLGN